MAVLYFYKHSFGIKRPLSEGEESEERDSNSEEECEQSQLRNNPLTAFFALIAEENIKDFLSMDSCAKLADKYLLAMVYVYFRRALLPLKQYNRMNFFAALFLAHVMEEEDQEMHELFFWALGESWVTRLPVLVAHRDDLWHQMGFRALVSRRTCEEVISMAPSHEIWQRARLPYHGGALRCYMKPASPGYDCSFPCTYCKICGHARQNTIPDVLDEKPNV